MSTELVPLDLVAPLPAIPTTPQLPIVRLTDLYSALLADARKPTTRRAREQDIADLARFVGCPDPSAACVLFLEGGAPQANAIASAWARSMLDVDRAPATINRRVSTLRRLVRLGRRYNVLSWTMDVDSLPVTSYRDTTGPGRSGWVRLLEVAMKAAATTAKGKRDLAIVRLLHDHGLRRAEVTALDLVDLDLDAGRLLVIGKGLAEKTPITLNSQTVLALSRWLEPEARGAEPGPLFVRLDKARRKGELTRLDGDGVHLVVGQLGRKARLSRAVKPHGLRHEAVSRVLMLTNGNIDAAQKFARHKDPKTTQRYNDSRLDVAGAMARLLGDDS